MRIAGDIKGAIGNANQAAVDSRLIRGDASGLPEIFKVPHEASFFCVADGRLAAAAAAAAAADTNHSPHD